MRISEEEQRDTDFDWFCVDEHGNIGHFASAGFKSIPPTVSESAEKLRSLEEYFASLDPVPGGHQFDEGLDPAWRTERYAHTFIAMADRGLFSFDIESYPRTDICYFRVASPKAPLRFDDLPDNIRTVLGRTVLRKRSLEHSSKISYAETLSI